MKKQTIYSRISTAIFAVWAVFSVLTLLLVLLLRSSEDYFAKAETALPSVAAVFILGVIATVFYLWSAKPAKTVSRRPIWLLSAGLFVVQIILFYNIYFLTNWDTLHIISAAQMITSPNYTGMVSPYLSMYPNNLLLTWLYSVLFPAGTALSLHWAYFVILIQCALAVLGGLMLFSLASDLTSSTAAYFVWAVYAIHIGLSPWLGILYSDPITLCVPISILYLYHRAQNGRRVPLKWCAIGVLACVGYLIKPFSAIAAIAVVLVSLFHGWEKRELHAVLKACAAFALAVAVAFGIFKAVIIPSTKLELDPEARLGAPHFLMMGLNENSNGAWSVTDVLFSASQPDIETRTAANLSVFAERLREMGLSGLAEHGKKKLLVNFADGTYAWGQEGDFYFQILPEPNDSAAPFLRSLFYNHGDNYKYWETIQNIIWYTLLLGSSYGAFTILRRREHTPIVMALYLSLLGISAYVMIFESRARYLFIYAPVFLLAAACGLKREVRTKENKTSRKRSKR